jgi:putative ABC transport system ATP-binding protein
LIELRNLTKTYREGDTRRTVLEDINARLATEETVVLLGRSGSGKTTLLNLISGIDLPTRGRILYNDTNLTDLSARERTLFRRQNIGFIFQSFNLIDTLSVIENVLLPLELSGRSEGRANERALDLLDEVGLGDRADSFPDRLSGGEQQRVTMARAIAHDPLLILADEPTGNLDYETGQEVMGFIERLVRRSGTTLLMATHDHDMIDLSDRILRLHGGRIEEITADEALRR